MSPSLYQVYLTCCRGFSCGGWEDAKDAISVFLLQESCLEISEPRIPSGRSELPICGGVLCGLEYSHHNSGRLSGRPSVCLAGLSHRGFYSHSVRHRNWCRTSYV
ncbi:hypothetical protein ILYODFUR_018287 [Ilyodon furcidens]|uniref:Uncharacterized protein n=1 Tax=Ilyodon furcidens TaxID=33524 RepID=A0ABV0TW38_9TELE